MVLTSYFGADGCRAGWATLEIRTDGSLDASVFHTFSEVIKRVEHSGLTLVDIPIGLADGLGIKRRRCDVEARSLLGKSGSSVFPTPVREAARASTYEEAQLVQRERAGFGLSRQTWAITPKIREVDEIMTARPGLQERVRESHPEVCFKVLNGLHSLVWSKNTYFGVRERLRLLSPWLGDLEAYMLSLSASFWRAGISADDLVDAAVLALHARLASETGLVSIPPEPEVDEMGLRMEIVHANPRGAADDEHGKVNAGVGWGISAGAKEKGWWRRLLATSNRLPTPCAS